MSCAFTFSRPAVRAATCFSNLSTLICSSRKARNFPASGHRFRFKMNCHGFPKACDHKYLFDDRLDRFDHRLDRFDHRLSKRCSALGCINTLADRSTCNSLAGTVSDSYPHSRACLKSNTRSYADSESDAIAKPSTCRNASPAFTPPQIALRLAQVIRVYRATGNVIEPYKTRAKSGETYRVKQRAVMR